MSYKVRPALSTKVVLEYCKEIDFDLPENFNKFEVFDDADLISKRVSTDLLEFLENHIDNPLFFLDLAKIIEKRWIEFFDSDLKFCKTQAEALCRFYQIYPGRMASLDWRIIECEHYISLIANRKLMASSSKFDDLILFTFVSKLMESKRYNISNDLLVELPFERSHYKNNLDLFNNVTFENGNMILKVSKEPKGILNHDESSIVKSDVSFYDQVVAAVNMSTKSELTLESLSFRFGISPRAFQRNLNKHGFHLKDIIRKVHFKRVLNIMVNNEYNLKKTYLECGYSEQSQLSHLFKKESGMSPREYIEFHFKGGILNK